MARRWLAMAVAVMAAFTVLAAILGTWVYVLMVILVLAGFGGLVFVALPRQRRD